MTTHTHPAGTAVRYDGTSDSFAGKMFTVLDPDASLDSAIKNDQRRSTREFVEGQNGLHWWLEADMLTPVPTLADEYPVGCTVRDVKYNLVGTVTGSRRQSGMPVLVVQFPGSVNTSVQTASFAHPEGRLERIHVLTHDELVAIDGGVRAGTFTGNHEAGEILDKHLRPMVTDTYAVTVERPASADTAVDPSWLQQTIQRQVHGASVTVTIAEATTTTKEN